MRALVCLAILAFPLLGADDKIAVLGRALADEMERSNPPFNSPAVSLYANAIGQRLATAISNSGAPYRFTVVKDDVGSIGPEPLVLPAGYVFIPARLFLRVSNEAEFASALAYSMIKASEQHGPVFKLDNGVKKTPPDPKIQAAAQDLVHSAAFDITPSTEFLAIQAEIRELLPKRQIPSLYSSR